MTCDQFDAALEAYLGHALPADRSWALETHAASCARCETILDRRTMLPLGLQPAAPPASARGQVLREIRRLRTRRALRWGGLAAAAAVAVLMLGPDVREKRASDVPGGASLLVASRLARPEFEALDQAARELEEALRASPEDAELRAFLASVIARREVLSRLIRDAAS